MSLTVAVTGSSGLIGTALTTALTARGDQVVRLVRREPEAQPAAGVREVQWDPSTRKAPEGVLHGVDAVVNLAGAGIGDRRWSAAYKEELRSSRLDSTTAISAAVAEAGGRVRLLSGSAVGYYGNRGDDVLTEESGHGKGFLAQLSRDWEAATWHAQEAGAPVTLLRTGLVLSPEGGAMGRMLPLARFGLGGPLGSGKQFWPWITLHDHVRALLFLLDHDSITGPVNLTAPTPVRQKDVAKELGSVLHRPSVLPAPGPALRVALGEMADDITDSQRAYPQVLLDHGFTFEHPTVHDAASWLVEANAGADQDEAAPPG